MSQDHEKDSDPEGGAHQEPQDKGERHEGPDSTSPYPVERGAPAYSLVNTAQEIELADQMVHTQVSGKLKVIADQIKALQAEAQDILDSAQQDMELHKAKCNFKRQPGKVYHLYQKEDGTLYFSMLSPEDRANQPPHAFQGSYRLEPDYSWTPAEKMDEPDDTRTLVNRLLEDRGLDQ